MKLIHAALVMTIICFDAHADTNSVDSHLTINHFETTDVVVPYGEAMNLPLGAYTNHYQIDSISSTNVVLKQANTTINIPKGKSHSFKEYVIYLDDTNGVHYKLLLGQVLTRDGRNFLLEELDPDHNTCKLRDRESGDSYIIKGSTRN